MAPSDHGPPRPAPAGPCPDPLLIEVAVVRTPGSPHPAIGVCHTPTAVQALTDAALLTGVDLQADDVVDIAVCDWEMPSAMTPAARKALRQKLSRFDGLAVTGSWVSGNGIAAVVRGAQEVVS